MRAAIGVANDYVSLTKPRIISLLLLTCVATMFVADPGGPPLSTILWTCLGGYLAAGGAGAINHYIERERDARMARTASRDLNTVSAAFVVRGKRRLTSSGVAKRSLETTLTFCSRS